MLGLEVIKQTLTNENKISSSTAKKIIKASMYDRVNCYCDSWKIKNIFERISNAKISEEEKGQLIECFRTKAEESIKDIEKTIIDFFGEEKQASVGEKEEIGKAEEGEASENAQDEDDDEHKTPAEHVVEQKPGQSLFNY